MLISFFLDTMTMTVSTIYILFQPKNLPPRMQLFGCNSEILQLVTSKVEFYQISPTIYKVQKHFILHKFNSSLHWTILFGDLPWSLRSTSQSLYHNWISCEPSYQKLGQWALSSECDHCTDTYTEKPPLSIQIKMINWYK